MLLVNTIHYLIVMRETTYKITLQNPNPSDETALRNFSIDFVDWRIRHGSWTEGIADRQTINFPRKTPSTNHDPVRSWVKNVSMSGPTIETCIGESVKILGVVPPNYTTCDFDLIAVSYAGFKFFE
jgi:hypothetical protein